MMIVLLLVTGCSSQSEDTSLVADTSQAIEFKPTDQKTLHYYGTHACEDCKLVEDFLLGLPDFVHVEKANIADDGITKELTALFEAYQVPKEKQQVPILFIGRNYLSGAREIVEELPAVIELESSNYEIVSRPNYSDATYHLGMTEIGSILGAGLINGLSPCSLSRMLLFLSLLTVIATKQRQFRILGFGFILGRWLAYLGLGFLINTAIATVPLELFFTVRYFLSIFLIILSALLAIGNFMDFYYIKKEEYGKVKVRLPKKIRKASDDLLKKIMDPKYGKSLFVIVMGSSMLIALAEFFCTGQIYLTMILGFMNQADGAVLPPLFFILYVTMLLVPVILLFLFVDRGKSVLNLSEKSLHAMGTIKLLSGMVFVIMILITLWTM